MKPAAEGARSPIPHATYNKEMLFNAFYFPSTYAQSGDVKDVILPDRIFNDATSLIPSVYHQ
jgi:hypothetical protein